MSEKMIFDRCMDVTGLGIGPCCVGRDAGHLKDQREGRVGPISRASPQAVLSCRRQERASSLPFPCLTT